MRSIIFASALGTFGAAREPQAPAENATIKDEMSFVNSVIGALVGVIYYPTTVEVYCDTGKTAQLTLTPETLVRIGKNPATMRIVHEISAAKAQELAEALVRSESRRVAAERMPATL